MSEDRRLAFTAVYDGAKGEVQISGFGVEEAITVRQSMVDKAVRHAAVVELERLGYTVTKPGAPLTNYEYEMLALIQGLLTAFDPDLADVINGLEIDDLLDRARGIVQS